MPSRSLSGGAAAALLAVCPAHHMPLHCVPLLLSLTHSLRLRRENDALKGLLLELAADRQAAQARLSELQVKMSEMASTSSLMGEVSG
jgi:hypothetical protein